MSGDVLRCHVGRVLEKLCSRALGEALRGDAVLVILAGKPLVFLGKMPDKEVSCHGTCWKATHEVMHWEVTL